MTTRSWRVFSCAIITAALASVSTITQAKIYPIGFDPNFDGTVFIDVNPSCTGTGFQLCNVDLVSADVFDSNFPLIDYTAGATLGVGDAVFFSGGVITQFRTVPNNIVVSHLFCDGDCFTDNALLQFSINPQGSGLFPGIATLTFTNANPNPLTDNYVVGAAIPEPGTLGLLLGAFGAGWLARRRKATG